jgi:hypothetical protein
VTHNSTIAEAVSEEDLAKLRVLADTSQFAINGNTSTPGSIIGGRTLATRILEALNANINTEGAYNKLTLNFGSFEPMMSFFALAGLTSSSEQFYAIPELGASMVIELFTLIVDGNSTGLYPSDSSDLFVRFLYTSGTGEDAQLIQYPLFGADPDNLYVSFDNFVAGMAPIATLSIEDWCQECGSFSVFCPAFDDSTTTGSDIVSSSRHGLSPALAGVIGALVTLVVLALLIGLAMLVLGLRFFRVKNKRRSELAGFKGAEKLASDQDLTVPKGGAGAVITEGPVPGRGHERVGSWELRDSGKVEEAQLPIDRVTSPAPRRPSFEDDDLNVNPYSIPVKPKDQL